MTRFLTAFVFAALALPGAAQDIDCAAAFTQRDLNFCAEADWMAADEELNTAYREAMAVMEETDAGLPEDMQGAVGALRTAQRAWISYRDANCEAAGFAMRGGSAEPLVVYGCRLQVTENRTEELRNLVGY